MSISVNDFPVKTFNFPAGECHVNLLPEIVTPKTVIKAILHNANDIMALLLTVDAIARILPTVSIELIIPYFPYARQDRVCNQGEALSVKVMADLINSLKCDRIVIIDPHSDVTPALLNNCQVITQADILVKSELAKTLQEENWVLIAPDAGEQKKTMEVAKRLGLSDVFCGSKIRNTKTGKILTTTFHDDVRGRKVLIVDDICDGGRTFIELAKVLQKKEAQEIALYVTHGIFSQGLVPLRPYFTQIYCYHTMLSLEEQDTNFLTILPLILRENLPSTLGNKSKKVSRIEDLEA
ncbi:MAG: ribose-phosphate pyrophosphokinase [Cyanobacteria bacterium]|nr:ribose-phosphate pyrophosphokinase [Cyanobacteria bacterium CG_2015-16_32_12]NCO78605.1 ribose-phosphate pyrophosphokinase [Cyanobacteria bacterium CG_2015-22_32_23]NCQ02997.1 ribose-phosphate pyrophosphokinase [Cyanobacteria bacterium CG_2015-09_32_10]NCQ41781.1 ribose-phosphate pyrophosphokinase [Cyanobacteria bacterium CG_2015-04_32_10]NCS83688.1 ribose-phosphate pyrophosphokinase [Cyanobacteria bacterium CG_2015-02_32_10]